MSPNDRVIVWRGELWHVKESVSEIGPGPNRFGSELDNVFIDQSNFLHLRIVKRGDAYYCSEVVMSHNLGYGRYRFDVRLDPGSLDSNVVVGLFLWADNPGPLGNHLEIDWEISLWGNNAADAPNTQLVLQPWDASNRVHKTSIPPGFGRYAFVFDWHPGVVKGQLLRLDTPDGRERLMHEGRFTEGVPEPNDENPRINFWLFQPGGPASGRDQEIVIERFEFTPSKLAKNELR
jgi:hypothetical protein